MLKLKYSICCGLDIHKNVIVATIVITNKDGISEHKQNSFSTINSDIKGFITGSLRIIVITFAWNPQESIGFLFLIFAKMTWMSALHILNMSKPLKAKKRTKRIPNGSPTFKFDLVRS
ncbi:hypothetical protein C823_005392 [Eubacterium plexicaudatum ASF492]|uniref:Uncharacterized protein n=1 Tax=Eubacterium plexicaudatum ASF492 TaxID=1235802 RepID=N2BB08_9FIRM|nr:hypothetical protein C823_005392 [Eubacterium plexicaudatum ASF492]